MNSFANELQNLADAQKWIRNWRTTIYDKDQMGDATQSESSNGHKLSSTTTNWDVFSSHKGFIAAASASRMGVQFRIQPFRPASDSSTKWPMLGSEKEQGFCRWVVSFAFLEAQLWPFTS